MRERRAQVAEAAAGLPRLQVPPATLRPQEIRPTAQATVERRRWLELAHTPALKLIRVGLATLRARAREQLVASFLERAESAGPLAPSTRRVEPAERSRQAQRVAPEPAALARVAGAPARRR